MRKQTRKTNYIKQLEYENMILREEVGKLKHKILFGYQQDNISLLQKELLIASLKKELAKAKQQNLKLLLSR